MTARERSVTDILQDIIRDFQEIVRSEVRLAKREIGDEVKKAKAATFLITLGALAALYAFLFLLVSLVDALALVIPHWAAALIVAAALAMIAGGTLRMGMKHFRRVHPLPERTVEILKEDVKWATQHAK